MLLLFTESHLEKNVKRFKIGDHFTDGPFWTVQTTNVVDVDDLKLLA